MVSLGARDDDVGVGAASDEGVAVLTDANRHVSKRVYTLRYGVHPELGQGVRHTDDAIDGLVDRVHRSGAGRGVGNGLPVGVDELHSSRGDLAVPQVTCHSLHPVDLHDVLSAALAGHERHEVGVGHFTHAVGQFLEGLNASSSCDWSSAKPNSSRREAETGPSAQLPSTRLLLGQPTVCGIHDLEVVRT